MGTDGIFVVVGGVPTKFRFSPSRFGAAMGCRTLAAGDNVNQPTAPPTAHHPAHHAAKLRGARNAAGDAR